MMKLSSKYRDSATWSYNANADKIQITSSLFLPLLCLAAAKQFPACYAGKLVQKEHLRHTSKYRILRFTSQFEVADVRE